MAILLNLVKSCNPGLFSYRQFCLKKTFNIRGMTNNVNDYTLWISTALRDWVGQLHWDRKLFAN